MNSALMGAELKMGIAAWLNQVQMAFFASAEDGSDPSPARKTGRSVKKPASAKAPKPKPPKSGGDGKPKKPSKPRAVKKKNVEAEPAPSPDLQADQNESELGEFQPLNVVIEPRPETTPDSVPVNEIPKEDLPFIVPRENPRGPERPVSRSLKYSPDSFAVPPRRRMAMRMLRFWGGVFAALAVIVIGVNYFIQNRPAAPEPAATEIAVESSATSAESAGESPAAVNPTAAPSTSTAVPPTSTPAPTVVPTLGVSSTMTADDGMTLAYVPGGEFMMGSEADEDEQPLHSVTLSPYWIDQTEVTNAMYLKCVDAGACQPPISVASHARDNYFYNPDFSNYPVVFVSWVYANDYCTWAGRRLPTEAEWELAARGTDAQTYPWGEQAPDPSLLNLETRDTTEVGRYSAGASPYGVLDMAGNVWEWVADWYGPAYYADSPAKDPKGPESPIDPTFGELRVLRGGSWDRLDGSVRSADRNQNGLRFTNDRIGFRCAMDVAK